MKNSQQHSGNVANVTLYKNINLVPKATFSLSHDFIFLKTSPLLGRLLVPFNLQSPICSLQSAVCGLQSANVIHHLYPQIKNMSKNLAPQISRDLHSDCFAMLLTAGFYCDSRAHNVRKVRVVKYMVVYGQIKAADQKYCHNQKWRRKLKEISFRTLKRFWRQFR